VNFQLISVGYLEFLGDLSSQDELFGFVIKQECGLPNIGHFPQFGFEEWKIRNREM
jgi:hypothetical protein